MATHYQFSKEMAKLALSKESFLWLENVIKSFIDGLGSGDPVHLKKAVEILLSKANESVESCLRKKKHKRTKRLCNILRDFLCHLHLRSLTLNKPMKDPCYEDLAAALLSYIVDLKMVIGTKHPQVAQKKAKDVIEDMLLFLGDSPIFLLDVLLQCNTLKNNNNPIVSVVFKRILSEIPNKILKQEQYLKFLLCLRLWLKSDRLSKKEIISFAIQIKPPKRFSSWLDTWPVDGAPLFKKSDGGMEFVKTFLSKKMTQEVVTQYEQVVGGNPLSDDEDLVMPTRPKDLCVTTPTIEPSETDLISPKSSEGSCSYGSLEEELAKLPETSTVDKIVSTPFIEVKRKRRNSGSLENISKKPRMEDLTDDNSMEADLEAQAECLSQRKSNESFQKSFEDFSPETAYNEIVFKDATLDQERPAHKRRIVQCHSNVTDRDFTDASSKAQLNEEVGEFLKKVSHQMNKKVYLVVENTVTPAESDCSSVREAQNGSEENHEEIQTTTDQLDPAESLERTFFKMEPEEIDLESSEDEVINLESNKTIPNQSDNVSNVAESKSNDTMEQELPQNTPTDLQNQSDIPNVEELKSIKNLEQILPSTYSTGLQSLWEHVRKAAENDPLSSSPSSSSSSVQDKLSKIPSLRISSSSSSTIDSTKGERDSIEDIVLIDVKYTKELNEISDQPETEPNKFVENEMKSPRDEDKKGKMLPVVHLMRLDLGLGKKEIDSLCIRSRSNSLSPLNDRTETKEASLGSNGSADKLDLVLSSDSTPTKRNLKKNSVNGVKVGGSEDKLTNSMQKRDHRNASLSSNQGLFLESDTEEDISDSLLNPIMQLEKRFLNPIKLSNITSSTPIERDNLLSEVSNQTESTRNLRSSPRKDISISNEKNELVAMTTLNRTSPKSKRLLDFSKQMNSTENEIGGNSIKETYKNSSDVEEIARVPASKSSPAIRKIQSEILFDDSNSDRGEINKLIMETSSRLKQLNNSSDSDKPLIFFKTQSSESSIPNDKVSPTKTLSEKSSSEFTDEQNTLRPSKEVRDYIPAPRQPIKRLFAYKNHCRATIDLETDSCSSETIRFSDDEEPLPNLGKPSISDDTMKKLKLLISQPDEESSSDENQGPVVTKPYSLRSNRSPDSKKFSLLKTRGKSRAAKQIIELDEEYSSTSTVEMNYVEDNSDASSESSISQNKMANKDEQLSNNVRNKNVSEKAVKMVTTSVVSSMMSPSISSQKTEKAERSELRELKRLRSALTPMMLEVSRNDRKRIDPGNEQENSKEAKPSRGNEQENSKEAKLSRAYNLRGKKPQTSRKLKQKGGKK